MASRTAGSRSSVLARKPLAHRPSLLDPLSPYVLSGRVRVDGNSLPDFGGELGLGSPCAAYELAFREPSRLAVVELAMRPSDKQGRVRVFYGVRTRPQRSASIAESPPSQAKLRVGALAVSPPPINYSFRSSPCASSSAAGSNGALRPGEKDRVERKAVARGRSERGLRRDG
jgi:hypothetical protein